MKIKRREKLHPKKFKRRFGVTKKTYTLLVEIVKKENQFSRYQHLGVAGSEAHINAVLSVVRRKQIEELTKAVDELKASWSDLSEDEKKVGNRAD